MELLNSDSVWHISNYLCNTDIILLKATCRALRDCVYRKHMLTLSVSMVWREIASRNYVSLAKRLQQKQNRMNPVIAYYATINGCTEMMNFINQHNWRSGICRVAATDGDLNAIIWTLEYYPKQIKRMLAIANNAAKNGHFDVVIWACQFHHYYDNDLYTHIIIGGHLEILIWMSICQYYIGFTLRSKTRNIKNIIEYDHLHLLIWYVITKNIRFNMLMLDEMVPVGFDQLEILIWMLQTGLNWSNDLRKYINQCGSLTILIWAYQAGHLRYRDMCENVNRDKYPEAYIWAQCIQCI